MSEARKELHWLVDGMNVIGSRPDGWWRDRPAAMRALVSALAGFAEETGDAVTVVFDGRPVGLPDHGQPLLRVEFAPGGPNAADREIVGFATAEPEPDRVRVVTSDRELAAAVRAVGVTVAPAASFRLRLGRENA